MFSTSNPPTIQRMPWPRDEEDSQTEEKVHTYDTWILNEDDFSWMKEPEGKLHTFLLLLVSVTILFSRYHEDYKWANDRGRSMDNYRRTSLFRATS